MDWRRQIAADIRALLGAAGADEVQITLPAEQAEQMARGMELWASITTHGPAAGVQVMGRRRGECAPLSASAPEAPVVQVGPEGDRL